MAVHIYISIPPAVDLVRLAKLVAAALKTQRTCRLQSESLTAHVLRRLEHPSLTLTPTGWLMCRRQHYVSKESRQKHVNDVVSAAARSGTMADRVMCVRMNRYSVQHV